MNHITTTMLACGIMLAALPTARADTTCPPDLFKTTVNGNLIVLAGQGCALDAVTVTGNVQVQTNASLGAGGPFLKDLVTIVGNVSVGTGAQFTTGFGGNVTIHGNLEVNQCRFVDLVKVAVGGNVQIQYCTDVAGLGLSDIAGNVGCNNNMSGCSLNSNHVNGNVEVNDNSSADVSGNAIGNNLECEGNASISDDGVANTVGGHKSGQCAGL